MIIFSFAFVCRTDRAEETAARSRYTGVRPHVPETSGLDTSAAPGVPVHATVTGFAEQEREAGRAVATAGGTTAGVR